MTYARRTDANHGLVKRAFEKMGCSVLDLSRVGGGAHDLLVGLRGVNVLVEVKAEKGKLNDDQAAFHAAWKGPKAIARSISDAALIVGEMGELARVVAPLSRQLVTLHAECGQGVVV